MVFERIRRFFSPTLSTETRKERWFFEPTLDGKSDRLIPVEVAIHPSPSSRVVAVLMPGWKGSIDGYQDKYLKIADHIRAHCGASVVRSGNDVVPGQDFELTCKARLRGLLNGVQEKARSFCGSSDPEIWLMGISAGASAMAALAADVPRVTKLLLIAPSSDAGYEAVVDGLRRFTGEVWVTVGANDTVVKDLPETLFEETGTASSREFIVVSDCDHQFRGEANGRILSQAPLWAFAGDRSFPSPSAGIWLYD